MWKFYFSVSSSPLSQSLDMWFGFVNTSNTGVVWNIRHIVIPKDKHKSRCVAFLFNGTKII